MVVKVDECSRRRSSRRSRRRRRRRRRRGRRRRRRRVGARVGAGDGDVAIMPFFRNVAPICFLGLGADC